MTDDAHSPDNESLFSSRRIKKSSGLVDDRKFMEIAPFLESLVTSEFWFNSAKSSSLSTSSTSDLTKNESSDAVRSPMAVAGSSLISTSTLTAGNSNSSEGSKPTSELARPAVDVAMASKSTNKKKNDTKLVTNSATLCGNLDLRL